MSDLQRRAQRAGEVARAMAAEQDRRNAEALAQVRAAEIREVTDVARMAGVSHEIALTVIAALDARRAGDDS